MGYAKVESGAVVQRFDVLPRNYENTSGFRFLTPSELADRGWLPVEDVKPALGPYESFGDPVVTVAADKVTYTYPAVPAVLAAVKQGQRKAFREQLKTKLYETYDVDDYVALLVLNVVPAALKTRVQNLKTAYDDAIAALNAAATVATALAVTPAWPA
jgi:hypothetical protein